MIPVHHAVAFQKHLWDEALKKAQSVVDATCGNGYDTLYLAQRLPKGATLHAIDIQSAALSATKLRLETAELSKVDVRYHLGSHEMVLEELISQTKPFDLAVFNLGYLPKGDHALITQAHSTIQAISYILEHLAPQGLATIVAYPGTSAGEAEACAVEAYLAKIPQQLFHISQWRPLNQVNKPPILYIIRGR